MSFMFSGCSSLISFPDISKWDTTIVKNIRSMFYGCNEMIIPKKFIK